MADTDPVPDPTAELLALLKQYRQKIDTLESRISLLDGTATLEEVENIPLTPISDRPCQLCGDIHNPKATVVTCICLTCEQKRPLIHCGYCQECTYKALGMSMGYELAAQAVPDPDRPKMPWEA